MSHQYATVAKVVKYMRSLILNLMISMGIILAAGHSLAASGPWQGSDIFQARLVTATDQINASGQLDAGLEIKLKEGWKIYWRSPGDAGLPPELDFTASPVVKSHTMDFPAPYRFSVLGFDSYGYKDHVIFPLELDLAPIQRDAVMAASFTGLVCDDVCIPVDETLTINLGFTGDDRLSPSDEARDIARYAALVPRVSTAAGVSVASLQITGSTLQISFAKDGQTIDFREGDVFIEGTTGYSFAKPKIHPNFISLDISGSDPSALNNQLLTITAVTPEWLLEEQKTVSLSSASGRMTSVSSGLMVMIAIAFMGGLILNVMPCVLPVISLKLAQVMGLGGQGARVIRVSFLATAAGIVTSFMLLGLILFALRQAGVAIGWGIQFQNIYFLGLAAAAISAFALIMLDIITIPVPQSLASFGRDKTGYIGDFLTGFMATLLATPCSAPFVGTALTFALTAPTQVLLIMFFAMGLGLASPWIIISARPSLAARLPRPGPWLNQLKRVLALGLFITAGWLVSIMVTISGNDINIDGDWQVWSQGSPQALAEEGHVVLVDVTAAWCLTCKANKALVLDTEATTALFDQNSVKRLRADWTRPDPAISAYLAQHDRFGIPFNIVYGPKAKDGIILPELLTADAVKNAIQKAR